MFANVTCAYILWFFLGLFGAHRFYVGRPVSGLVWLFTLGLFGLGWVVDFFLLRDFVEEHNKRVFHQQMLETGSSLLFDGEYGVGPGGYPSAQPAYGAPYGQQQGGAPNPYSGAVAPYAQHVYMPAAPGSAGKGGGYDGGGYAGAGGNYGGGYY